MRILLIEDDAETAAYILQGLQEAGHVAEAASDGSTGLFRAMEETWDLLVIDRMLPRMDGLNIVRMLRAGNHHTPVLFLTTVGGIDDRVAGLNAGADDYLVKPFAFSELLARANALGRRPRATAPDNLLRVADLELDLLSRTARRGSERIELQPREFRLLEYLMRHAGQVVTRTMLLEQVWDLNFDPRTNVVETNVSRLRAKIDKGHAVELIHTLRGAGYSLRVPE